MKYKSLTTGEIYRHLAWGVDRTEGRVGRGVVVYCPDDDEYDIHVMDAQEHDMKFELLK